jgi:hypothetical protein
VLRDSSFASLSVLGPTVEWWRKQKNPAPLVMTEEEIRRSTDVFVIEFLDMQRHHRVLFGDKILDDLQVTTAQHRVQVEYELREKVIILRQGLLAAGDDKRRLWELLLGSFPAFATLFRHALLVLGGDEVASKRAGIESLAKRIHFDPSAFLQVLDVREHKVERKQIDVKNVFTRYLETVHRVTNAVDTMLEGGQ